MGRLNSLSQVCHALEQVAAAAGLHEVARAHHSFEPQGVSAVLLLSESHVAVHTWPQTGTAYLTLTSCKDLDPRGAALIGTIMERCLGGAVTNHEETGI